jgi:hypothetical protein
MISRSIYFDHYLQNEAHIYGHKNASVDLRTPNLSQGSVELEWFKHRQFCEFSSLPPQELTQARQVAKNGVLTQEASATRAQSGLLVVSILVCLRHIIELTTKVNSIICPSPVS